MKKQRTQIYRLPQIADADAGCRLRLRRNWNCERGVYDALVHADMCPGVIISLYGHMCRRCATQKGPSVCFFVYVARTLARATPGQPQKQN